MASLSGQTFVRLTNRKTVSVVAGFGAFHRTLPRSWLTNINCCGIERVLQMCSIEPLDHLDAGAVVFRDLVDVGALHQAQTYVRVAQAVSCARTSIAVLLKLRAGENPVKACLPRTARLTIPEKSLSDHGLKWWPSKRYAADFSSGVGESSEWRLEVESVVRAEATSPAEGIPFSLMLTIEDEAGSAPVFQSLRQTLVARRVDMQDIRTAVRVRQQTRR